MKKSIYIYYILATSALIWSACSGDNGIKEEPEPVVETIELTFTTDVQTRANVEVNTSLEDGESMNIYVGGALKKASRKNGIWSGEPSIIIPQNGSVSIQGAWPYNTSASSASAYPVDIESQKDYLYSGPTTKVTASNPKGNLIMKHAMAVLAFNINKESYSGNGKLEKIYIEGNNFYTKGSLNISTGNITGTTAGDYTLKTDVTIQSGGWTSNIPAFFCLPFSSSGENINLAFTIDGKDYTCKLPKYGIIGATKYIFRLAITDYGLMFFPEQTIIVSLNNDADTMPASNYAVLGVTHTNKIFTAPSITGTLTFTGRIHWGDGISENYTSTSTHNYSNSETHQLNIETWDAEEVSMKDLVGIKEIDLSEF